MRKFLITTGAVFAFVFLPRLVLAATIYSSPGSGSFSVGSTFAVSVRANTQGADVNTAEASVAYSTDTLELVSAKQGATFYLASPGSPAKSAGSVYFGGGLPTPGYNGTGGVLGTITFRAKALGNASVSISSGKVLLNDGNGTDAFAGSTGSHFTIIAPPVSAVTMTATTHPASDSWYAKPDVSFSWDRPGSAYGFSFDFDQIPDTVPDNILDTTTTTTKNYTGIKDGVWYFHIKPRAVAASAGFGPTTHFKVQIDTTPPEKFDVKLVGQSDTANVTQTPSISFETTDALSGVDHYQVFLNDQSVSETASSPYVFDKIKKSGDYVIKVVAFDKAGNKQTSQLAITIAIASSQGFLQSTLTLPMYVLLGIAGLFLLSLIVLILLFWRRRKEPRSRSDELADIQFEIDQGLEELKQKISTRLLDLTAKSSRELFDKEEQVSKEVAISVTKTRRSLDKKIGKMSKTVKKSKNNIED